MTLTLSALQQKQVWDGWIGAEIRAHYFAELGHRFQTQQRVATWLSLLASSGAVATWLSSWLAAWVPPAAAAVAASASLWSLVAQNQRRATDCADLHARWSRLANAYRALWDDMYAADAPARLAALVDREVDLSQSSTAFPNKPRLVGRAEEHVLQQHRHLLAGA